MLLKKKKLTELTQSDVSFHLDVFLVFGSNSLKALSWCPAPEEKYSTFLLPNAPICLPI